MNNAKRTRKAPPYCVQNDGNCWSCSLNNYGRDCINNPILKPKTRKRKIDRAIELAKCFKGRETIKHILSIISEELQERLSSEELAQVITAIDKAYKLGILSCRAEVVDDDAIWVEPLKNLYDIEDIKKLTPVRRK